MVAKIQYAESHELGAGLGAVVRNLEGSVAVFCGELLHLFTGNIGHLTFHEHLIGAVDILPKCFEVCDNTGHGVRIILGAVAKIHFAFGTGLGYSEGNTRKADGENQRCSTVVAGILKD